MSGVLDRRDFMRGSASMLTAGMALYSRDSDMSKGEEPQNRDSLPYKVKFYEFSEYEISDTCWALSMGPDGRIYAAACAENVPGGLVTQGRKPKTANLEVGVLLRLLKRAKLRHLPADDVKMLTVRRDPRQMLTPVEKLRLFETAAKKPAWQRAYSAALLAANGSMRPVELRRLLWRDLDPMNRTLTIRRSKTDAGMRVIPLNDEAWAAIVALKQSADNLETYGSDNFMFHREWPQTDGTKPMGRGGWRTAWRNLREEAAKGDKERGRAEMPRLANLRFYDLRHQFVTELCEAGVPEAVIRELAGHVDPAMMRIYSHPRLAAKRIAVEALAAVKVGQSEGGYVTNHITKALPAASGEMEVIEKSGRGAQI